MNESLRIFSPAWHDEIFTDEEKWKICALLSFYIYKDFNYVCYGIHSEIVIEWMLKIFQP